MQATFNMFFRPLCACRGLLQLALVCSLSSALACETSSEEPAITATTTALSSTPSPLKTALLGIHIGRGGHVAVAFGAKKDYPFQADHNQGDLRIEVRDSTTTGVLGVVKAQIPRLCDCHDKESHFEGDVEISHETTVLVKVPYSTGAEMLTVTAEAHTDKADKPTSITRSLAEVAQ